MVRLAPPPQRQPALPTQPPPGARLIGMTEFVGKISYRHRWLVVLIWALVMAGGVVAAGTVFERMDDSGGAANTESGRAREVLRASTDRGGDVIALWEGIDPTSATAKAALAGASG